MTEQEQRIAVIGSPGAGKSTLATALARATGLPLIHLDREHWQAGWVAPTKGGWQARHRALIAADRWIIDGNYGSSLPVRLARAKLVIWLDLPTRACLAGAVRRTWRYRDGDRPDMAEGCPERFDAEYLKFLWYIARFRRRKRGAIVRLLGALGTPVIQLRSRRQQAAFLRRLEEGGLAGATASPG